MPAVPAAAKAVPWRLVVEVATVVYTRFREDVPPKDRRRLGTLVRKSKGDPRRLTAAERRELLAILRRVDLQRLGRDVAAAVSLRRARGLLKRSG
jgi:hypothetical protein